MTSASATDSREGTESTVESESFERGADRPVRPGVVTIFPARQAGATVWPVRGSVVVGRSSEAAVQLTDPHVSRRHAALERARNGLQVEDLGSGHGTFVNGERLADKAVLAPFGAVIRIGATLLLVADDVSAYSVPVHRIAGERLLLARDVIAGPELRAVWQQAALVASASHPVLILGESGSGKESVARLIHATRESPGPFVALNLAAIPDGLFESEMFGHARGAFTGAVSARAGAFAAACGGVLFIDEVADLRADLQIKLLRALDDMRIRPVGSDQDIAVNVQLVAATSQDLRGACAAGKFRADLYYRLSGIVLRVPALRERRADVLLLASAFLQQEKREQFLSVRAAESLVLAHWRGNVRELYYAVARASFQAAATGSREILREHLLELDEFENHGDKPLTEAQVRTAITDADGNVSKAAKELGVSRTTFYILLRQYGVDPELIRNGK